MWHQGSNSKPACIKDYFFHLPGTHPTHRIAFPSYHSRGQPQQVPFSSTVVTIVKNKNLSGTILEIKSAFLIASVWLPPCFSTNTFWYPVWDLPQFICEKPLLFTSCEVKWFDWMVCTFESSFNYLCYWLKGLAERLSSALWSEIDCDQTHSNQLWHKLT